MESAEALREQAAFVDIRISEKRVCDYDMSTASLEVSREAADKVAEQLNAIRNARI